MVASARTDPRIAKRVRIFSIERMFRTLPARKGLSSVIGANFLLTEHCAALTLFRRLYVYQDSLSIGAIGFLILSGLGSLLISRRLRPVLAVLASLCMSVILAFGLGLPSLAGLAWTLPPEAGIALLAPVAFVTGSFFPAVFDLAARNPLGVFAMDAIGAALGSLAAFFLPIAFGFQVFFAVSAGVFLATVLACGLFLRGREASLSEERESLAF